MILNRVTVNPDSGKYHFRATDTALMADITVVGKDSIRYRATPLFYVRDNQMNYVLDTVFAQNLAIGLTRVLDNNRIELSVKESSRMIPFISLKVLEFPQINLLWLGTLVMIAGFLMSVARRLKQVG
jgi:cytochrome c-type biogenesis protein CcmF